MITPDIPLDVERKMYRLFSMLLNRPHNVITAECNILDGAKGKEALYLKTDHEELTVAARKRAKLLLEKANAGN